MNIYLILCAVKVLWQKVWDVCSLYNPRCLIIYYFNTPSLPRPRFRTLTALLLFTLTFPYVLPSQDFFTEASQSRINVLIPKLQEVNRCLNDLISCTGMVSISCLLTFCSFVWFQKCSRVEIDSACCLVICKYSRCKWVATDTLTRLFFCWAHGWNISIKLKPWEVWVRSTRCQDTSCWLESLISLCWCLMGLELIEII